MKIESGYNDKEVQIRIGNGNKDSRSAECFIEFKQQNPPEETLSYITLDELLDLKKEIEKVIKEIVE